MLDRTAILASDDHRVRARRAIQAEAERRALVRQTIRALVADEMGRRAQFAHLLLDCGVAERAVSAMRKHLAPLAPLPPADARRLYAPI